jgi:hypothetical protein
VEAKVKVGNTGVLTKQKRRDEVMSVFQQLGLSIKEELMQVRFGS